MKEFVDNRTIDYQTVHTVTVSPIKLFIAMIVVFSLVLLLIWSRVNFVAEGYKMSELTEQAQKLNEQIAQYNLEIATLKSRNRIEKIAKTQLNMDYPDSSQIITINK
ncbi:MAG: cell division protein FtsL [bacterium]